MMKALWMSEFSTGTRIRAKPDLGVATNGIRGQGKDHENVQLYGTIYT
jgi:hypothetical protein